MKNIIVQLRIYRGKVTYDKNLKVTSDVQTMKLKFGRLEWVNFVKTARLIYSKIEVIRCTDMDNGYNEIVTPDAVLQDVKKALMVEGVKLTPQEKEIKDLKEAVAKLTAKEESKPKKENTDELNSLREEYTKLYGKKPSHLMREQGLRNKIAEKS